MHRFIDAAKAEEHLYDLLDQIQKGQSFTITINGKPVAQLTPPHSPQSFKLSS